MTRRVKVTVRLEGNLLRFTRLTGRTIGTEVSILRQEYPCAKSISVEEIKS